MKDLWVDILVSATLYPKTGPFPESGEMGRRYLMTAVNYWRCTYLAVH
jgi:hypothetical protein